MDVVVDDFAPISATAPDPQDDHEHPVNSGPVEKPGEFVELAAGRSVPDGDLSDAPTIVMRL